MHFRGVQDFAAYFFFLFVVEELVKLVVMCNVYVIPSFLRILLKDANISGIDCI